MLRQRINALFLPKDTSYKTATEEDLQEVASAYCIDLRYADPFTMEQDTEATLIAETGIDITDITDYGNY